MPTPNPIDMVAFRVFNGLAPANLSKTLPVAFDFRATAAGGSNGIDIALSLEFAEQEARLEFVQAVFIDNVLSGQTFSLTAKTTQQTLTIGAGLQMYMPFLAPGGTTFLGSTNSGIAAGLIRVQFLNFPVPAVVW